MRDQKITKRIEPEEAVELWEEMQGLEAEIERLFEENERLRELLGEFLPLLNRLYSLSKDNGK